ncbi:MAG: 23S rRNA (uracil(1939)-C(5))-methyltransferase RlmD [Coriobacteriia bacterium]|nr:23S rRNA (uracil(1939)-C(5))-methyltransferase RlmD [Coriobacteriia bacterium]
MQHEVTIESLVYTGAGLSHLTDGRVVFVPGALPGDQVLIETTADKKRYSEAKVLDILDSSEHRLAAPCIYADVCGGCPWQTLGYEQQLIWKRRFIVDALVRIGGIPEADSLVSEACASPHIWNYRNKVEFSVMNVNQRLQLVMHEAGSNQATAIKRCLLLPLHLTDLPGQLAGSLNYALQNEAVRPYRLGFRYSAQTKQSELALWSMPTGMRRHFVAQLLSQTVATSSLVRVLSRAEDASRDVLKTEVLSGRGYWSEDVLGTRYAVSAPSFFQVNTDVAELMVAYVMGLVARPDKHVWDLYSGVGTFSLPLAKAGATVSAVEIAGSSIRDLRRNLKASRLTETVDVFPGDTGRVIGTLRPADLAIVDPPASGIDQNVTNQLIQAPLSDLVYVSCNPQTLARDAKRLDEGGFSLVSARPFDLFPQTFHVETIAVFRR